MDSTAITALISGLCVAIPSVIATVTSNKKSQALIDYKIQELDKKVEKHNNIIERTYALEEKISIVEEKMKIFHDN